MKYKFIKIKYKDQRNKIVWWRLIDTAERLEAFIKLRANDIYNHYQVVKSRKNKKHGHYNHIMQYLISDTLIDAEAKRCSVVDDLSILNQQYLPVYIKMYLKKGHIIVGENFGFCWIDERSHEILEYYESDMSEFPNDKKYTIKDIKIKKWLGGKHYYAKVGNVDVEVSNMVKWNDANTAHKKAMYFMKKLNKNNNYLKRS